MEKKTEICSNHKSDDDWSGPYSKYSAISCKGIAEHRNIYLKATCTECGHCGVITFDHCLRSDNICILRNNVYIFVQYFPATSE